MLLHLRFRRCNFLSHTGVTISSEFTKWSGGHWLLDSRISRRMISEWPSPVCFAIEISASRSVSAMRMSKRTGNSFGGPGFVGRDCGPFSSVVSLLIIGRTAPRFGPHIL